MSISACSHCKAEPCRCGPRAFDGTAFVMRNQNRHRSIAVVRAQRAHEARKRAVERMEFYEDTAGEHRWRVKAANGEIIGASSEGFATQVNAKVNALLLAQNLQSWAEALTSEIERKFPK